MRSHDMRRGASLLIAYSLVVGNYAFGRAAPVRLAALASSANLVLW